MRLPTFSTLLVAATVSATAAVVECVKPSDKTTLVTSSSAIPTVSSTSTTTNANTVAMSFGTTFPTFVPYTAYVPTELQSFRTCGNMSMGTTEDLGTMAGLLLSNFELGDSIMNVPNNQTFVFEYGSQRVNLLFQEASNETDTTLPMTTIANQILQMAECCAMSGYAYCSGTLYYDLFLAELAYGQLASLTANITYSGNAPVNPVVL